MKKLLLAMLACAIGFTAGAQMTSTAEENIAAVKKYFEFSNQPNWMENVGFLFTPENFEMFKKEHAEFREVFPDYHIEILNISAKGDTVFTFGIVTGTHSKTWNLLPDIPATNKKIGWFESGVIIIKDGKAVGGIILNDRLHIMNQLGYGCKPEEIKL